MDDGSNFGSKPTISAGKPKYFAAFDDYRMQDPEKTVIAGHVHARGAVEPFYLTLASDKAVVISKFGIRELDEPEFKRESDFWLAKGLDGLLTELVNSPATFHPKYLPETEPGPKRAYKFVKGVVNKPPGLQVR